MSNTEQFTHVVNIIYAALARTFEEVKEPGKSALAIPLVAYAQGLDTGADTLRLALVHLYREHRIAARRLNYPSNYPETWEIVFITPSSGEACKYYRCMAVPTQRLMFTNGMREYYCDEHAAIFPHDVVVDIEHLQHQGIESNTPPATAHQAYTRPVCEISDEEAATLNHLYSGIDA